MDKKEDEVMMTDTTTYKTLNISNLKNKPSKIISTTEALQDVIHMPWSDKVLSGETKVSIDIKK